MLLFKITVLAHTLLHLTQSNWYIILPFSAATGVSQSYEWYTTPTNVKSLNYAKTITSTIQGQVSGTNLLTNPENANAAGWTKSLLSTTLDNTLAPDNTQTADKLISTTGTGEHYAYRNYTLTSFETFDTSTVTFDSGTETFDTGSASGDTQTYTSSVFFKAGGYDAVDSWFLWMKTLLQEEYCLIESFKWNYW